MKYSIGEIDTMIQAGKFGAAKTAIFQSELGLLEQSRFYRRLGMPSDAVRVLRREVLLDGKWNKFADSSLCLEYALNLTQLNLLREATDCLGRLSLQSFAYFQAKGFLAIRYLDFEIAHREFLSASVAKDASSYQKWVARVNGLNCLLGLFRYREVLAEAASLKKALLQDEHQLLLAYVYHYESQAFAFLGNQESFLKSSDTAYALLGLKSSGPSSTPIEFEFRRGRFVSERFLGGSSRRVNVLLEDALKFREYTGYQDLLLSKARDLKEQGKLLAGIPYPFFRKRLEHLHQKSVSIPSEISRSDRGKGGEVFNLHSGNRYLKPGQLPLRLLSVFVEDWFTRFSVPQLHEKIFPDRKHYHFMQSPPSVHQAVRRLNDLLKKSAIPLEVRSSDDRYYLHFTGKVTLQFSPQQNEPPFVGVWKIHFQKGWADSKTAGELMHVSQRQVRQCLSRHAEFFESKKEGKSIRYRLLNQEKTTK